MQQNKSSMNALRINIGKRRLEGTLQASVRGLLTSLNYGLHKTLQHVLRSFHDSLGLSGRLIISVKSYEPNVSCYPDMAFNDNGACRSVLDTIPAAPNRWNFTNGPPFGSTKVMVPDKGRVYTEGEYSNIYNRVLQIICIMTHPQ